MSVCAALAASAQEQSYELARQLIELPRIAGYWFDGDALNASSDGARITFATTHADTSTGKNATHIWLTRRATGWRSEIFLKEPEEGAFASAAPRIAPSGNEVGSIRGDGTLALIDVETRGVRTIDAAAFAIDSAPNSRRIDAFRWSPDERYIALSVRETYPSRTPSAGVEVGVEWDPSQGFDPVPERRLYVVESHGGTLLAMTRRGLLINDFAWHPDGNNIAVSADTRGLINDFLTSQDSVSDIYLFDWRTGATTTLVQRPGRDSNLSWSSDGRFLAFDTTENGEINLGYVPAVFDMRTRAIRLSKRREYAIYGKAVWIGKHAVLRVAARKMGCAILKIDVLRDTQEFVTPDDLSCNGNPVWSAATSTLVFRKASIFGADELYTLDWKTKRQRRITDFSQDLRLPGADVHTLEWRTPGSSVPIRAVLISPAASVQAPRPLLTLIEGGPSMVNPATGNYRSMLFAWTFVAQGFSVAMPNTRGRGGYETASTEAIRKSADYLPGPFEDVQAGVQHLIDRGIADPQRLAIAGFSYGSHVSAWAIAQTNRFKAALLGDPAIVDYVSFGRTFPTPLQGRVDATVSGFRNVYSKEGMEDRLRSSIVEALPRTKTPVLLECGFGTVASVYNGCLQLARGYRHLNLPLEFVVYPNTGHGIYDPKLRLESARRQLDWLAYWVLRQPVPRLVDKFGPAF